MISLFDQCLFVHIPKTAGQSIESVFLARAGLDWQKRDRFLLRANSDIRQGPPRLAHLTAQEYLHLGYVAPSDFASLFKFAVVRNPWERLVSEYRYKKYPYSFRDFVLRYFPKPGDDDYQDFQGYYRHVIPQYQYIYSAQGELMVDRVLRFENLAAEFAQMTQAQFGETLDLPYRNKTAAPGRLARFKAALTGKRHKPQQHYSQYYDTQTRDWVSEYYQQDIDMLGYRFEEVGD